MMKINFISKVHDFSISALVEWILSDCLNLDFLELGLISKKASSFLNEIVRLKKLKELNISAYEASELKEVTLIAFRITTTLLTSL
jgi:hypothetical protein